MIKWLSNFLDRASDYLARRKGLLPLVGIVSIFADGFLVETNLFLHLGLVIALIGLMLSWAL